MFLGSLPAYAVPSALGLPLLAVTLQLNFWNSLIVSDKIEPRVDQFIFPPRWLSAFSPDRWGVGDIEAISHSDLDFSRGFPG